MRMPTWEVVEVSPTRFQVNELREGERPVFVGLRESRAEADATVEKLRREYQEYVRSFSYMNSFIHFNEEA